MWSQGDAQEDQNSWGATHYYSVAGEPGEMLNDQAVVNAPGVPSKGSSHSNFRNLRVANKSAGPGLTERVVSVRYQWMPGGWTPGDNDDSFSVTRISWSKGFVSEPWGYDVYGNPITNSAFDAVDNPPTNDKFYKEVTIRRMESKYDLLRLTPFEGKVSSRDMVAGGVIFKAGTVMCVDIAPAEEYSANATAISMSYTLRFYPTSPSIVGNVIPAQMRNDPFRYWIIDTGLRGFYADGASGRPAKVIGDFYYLTGEPVSSSVRMNGAGAPYETGAYLVTSQRKTAVENPKPLPKQVVVVPLPSIGAVALGYQNRETADLLQLGL